MRKAFYAVLVLSIPALCVLSGAWGTAARAGEYLARLWPPETAYLPKLLPSVADTLKMSAVGSTLAFLTAIPLSYFGCMSLVRNEAVYMLTRLVLSVLRAMPVLVLGIMFVAALGFGPLPGVLGIWFHSIGTMGKLMSESLDAADLSVQEAAALDGATRWQTFVYVLLPMHVNAFLSYFLYSVESNFRDAVVLGIVGAGGIGVELIAAVGLFKYKRIGLVVVTIILTALAVDLLSRGIRSKLLDAPV